MGNTSRGAAGQPQKLTPIAIAVAAALIGTQSVEAQSTNSLDEITVTATRRAQSVQDVPYSISAMGQEEMTLRGITDFDALMKALPAVDFNDPSPRAGMNNAIIIRGLDNAGIGLNNRPLTQQPPVSTYINETPLFVNLRIKDVERVEVLRGPQGTLYGAGSLGGTVRFLYREPDPEAFDAEITAGVGQTADSDDLNYNVDAVFNIPLADTFAARLYAGREYQAGYIDAIGLYQLDANGDPVLSDPSDPINSPAALQSTKKDVNDVTTDSARISLLWNASDKVSFNFSYHYQKQEAGGRNNNAFTVDGEDGRVAFNMMDEPFESEINLASLEFEIDFGFATLTSSTSTYETTAEGVIDYLPLYLDLGIYESIYGASPRPFHLQKGANNNDGFVQELRLVSNGDGPVDWLVGAFYLDQDIELRNDQFYPGYQQYFDACFPVHGIWFTTGETVCGLGTIVGDRNGIAVADDTPYRSDVFTNYTDLAVFGEVTWHVNDAFQITGGLRAFQQDYTTTQLGGLLWAPDEPANRTGTGDASDVLFKINSSYDFTDSLMGYVTLSEGFRRGGINGIPTTIRGVPTNEELFEYDPDSVTNFEIGIKGTLTDRYRYNFTYFKMYWEDMQIDASATSLVLQTVENIGDATSEGIELEFSGSITDNLYISGGYSYVESKVDSLDFPVGLNGVPAEGAQLPGVPKNTANIHANYVQNLNNGWQITYAIFGAYRGEVVSVKNAGFDGDRNGQALTTWDVSATLFSNASWTLRAEIVNIFDEQANLVYVLEDFVRSNSTPLFGIPVSDPSPRLVGFNERAWSRITPPRIFGVSLRYEFGGK